MEKTATAWERCIEFHGHSCPGLAIGYRAALAAQQHLQLAFSPDEELVCVTENDACGVDAIQVLTGCSIGKGNLLYRDHGKQAFSFFDRAGGKRIRIVLKPGVFKEGASREELQKMILVTPEEELFAVSQPPELPPERARIFTSLVCQQCGESTAEHRIRLHEGQKVCLACCPDYSRGW